MKDYTEKYHGNIVFALIDTVMHGSMKKQYDIKIAPSFVIFEPGTDSSSKIHQILELYPQTS